MKPLECLPYLTVLFFTIIMSSCSSDDDEKSPEEQLPPITQTGENTFGCLIDGELFVPRDGTGTFAGPDRGLRMLGYYDNIEFDAHDYKSNKTAKIYIHLEDAVVRGTGVYQLVRSNGAENLDGMGGDYVNCRRWSKKHDGYQNYISYDGSGSVDVQYIELVDGVRNIRSGVFSFKLINTRDNTDTIQVSQGRFDMDSYKLRYATFD